MTSQSTFEVNGASLTVHKASMDRKPKMATKVVYDGRHVSYITADNKMFSTRVNPGRWYMGKRWAGSLPLIRDAISLGLLPKANTERVVKIEEARKKLQRARWAAKSILNDAATAGVTLPAALVRTLKTKAKAR